MIKELLSAIMMSDDGGSNLPAVTEEDNGKVLSVVNGEWNKKEPETDADAVKYTAQELTTAQQMQARENLGLYYDKTTDSIVFDGNPDGKEIIADYVRVSDKTPSVQDLVGAIYTYTEYGVTPHYTIQESDIDYLEEFGMIGVSLFNGAFAMMVCLSVPDQPYTVGVYFWNNGCPQTLTFSYLHKIEEKYLPDTTATKSYTDAAIAAAIGTAIGGEY